MNNSNHTSEDDMLNRLIIAVQTRIDYRNIHEEIILRIAARELAKGRGFKQTLKATRNKLHQIGGAYFSRSVDYEHWMVELDALPGNLEDPDLQDFCRRMMQEHASTRERLSSLERFYNQTLSSIAPVHSVLDMACGLNPLALPWMPLTENAPYYACDIYSDMMVFLGHFLSHVSRTALTYTCDLTQCIPDKHRVHLALLLKTLPCLEHLDKFVGIRLLESIPAEYILVSFPAQSLGGRSKGMVKSYTIHFQELINENKWYVQRFEFTNELAFLLRRND